MRPSGPCRDDDENGPHTTTLALFRKSETARLEVHLIADFGTPGVPGAIARANAGGGAMSRLSICIIASLSMGWSVSQASVSKDEWFHRKASIGNLPERRSPAGVCRTDSD